MLCSVVIRINDSVLTKTHVVTTVSFVSWTMHEENSALDVLCCFGGGVYNTIHALYSEINIPLTQYRVCVLFA